MAFTAVGTEVDAGATTGQGTVSVTTTTLGDLLVMFTAIASSTISVTGITGGGCGTWIQVGTPVTNVNTLQMWYGTTATVGTANATVTFSAAIGSVSRIFSYQKFSAGLGSTTIWSVDTSSHLSNTTSTAVTYPTLTPSSGTDLYVGLSQASSAATSGSTAGYTYQHISATTFELMVYNLAVTAASHPASTQATAGISITTAGLFTAASPSSTSGFMPFFM